MKVLLDTGVLGLVTHPRSGDGAPCAIWMRDLISAGVDFVIPEICDYELRRKYLHINSTNALKKLDELGNALRFERIDSAIWLEAASLWAQCRQHGNSLAPDHALDGDVLLIAITQRVKSTYQTDTVVATTNVKHLDQFVDARQWTNISSP